MPNKWGGKPPPLVAKSRQNVPNSGQIALIWGNCWWFPRGVLPIRDGLPTIPACTNNLVQWRAWWVRDYYYYYSSVLQEKKIMTVGYWYACDCCFACLCPRLPISDVHNYLLLLTGRRPPSSRVSSRGKSYWFTASSTLYESLPS